MRRGELPDERLDPGFVRNSKKQNYAYPKRSLATLVSEEPCYGTSASAVERTSDDQPRYIRITDYGDDGITLPHEFVAAEKWADKHLLSKGDLLFARSGATVGKTYLHDVRFDPAVFAGYCIRFRFNNEVLPEFVCGFTKTDAYASWVGAIQRPAGQPNINKEEFKSLEIPLPPLDIQRRLVAELDAARAERDRALAEAERLLKSIDKYVLAELAILPESDGRRVFAVRLNQVKPRLDADYHSPYFQRLRRASEQSKHATRNLDDLAVFMRSGFAAGRQDQARGDEAAVPHLRPLNLNAWGELSIAETKSVPASRVKEDDYLTQGEVLFNNTNSAEWVGKTAVFDLETPCACSNHMTRIALKPGIEPYFVAALLNAFRGIGYFSALSTFFNNQAGINTSTLAELRVPVPDADTQQTIAREVVDRKDKARRLQAHAETVWRKARECFEQQLLQGGKA